MANDVHDQAKALVDILSVLSLQEPDKIDYRQEDATKGHLGQDIYWNKPRLRYISLRFQVSVANAHHDEWWNVQDKIESKVSSELWKEIDFSPQTSLHPQHVAFLAFVVVNLLKEENSSYTDENEILKSLVDHVDCFNTDWISS